MCVCVCVCKTYSQKVQKKTIKKKGKKKIHGFICFCFFKKRATYQVVQITKARCLQLGKKENKKKKKKRRTKSLFVEQHLFGDCLSEN